MSRELYQELVGKRIELLSMIDDPDPLPVGSQGVVQFVSGVQDWVQIGVAWDNGRSLMLSIPPDRFRVVSKAVQGGEQ